MFADRNISIVNYIYKQENDTDDENYIKYRFNQKLLNKAAIVYSPSDFSLDNLKTKEFNLTHSNPKRTYLQYQDN